MLKEEGSFTRLFQRIRIPVILLFLAATLLSVLSIKRIRLDFGFHSLFEKSRDLPALDRYKKLYGEDINLVIVTLKAGSIFTEPVLRKVDGLTKFIDRQPEAEKVTSLTRVDVIRSGEDELIVEPFIKAIPSDAAALEALRREAVGNRQLRRFLISDDAKVTAVIVELKGHLKRQNRLIGAIEGWIEEDRRGDPGGGVDYYLGGVNVIQREYERVSTQDMVSSGVLILVIMGILLAVMYRNLPGVVLPVLSSVVSLALVLGLMAFTHEPITMISQLVPELIIILGIADGVYILSRYMEERKRLPAAQAFDVTMRAMTVACFFTSATTVAGFGSCVVAGMYIIHRFGIYIAAGVTLSFLSVILLVPSILSFGKGGPAAAGDGAVKKPGRVERLLDSFLAWVTRAVTRHGPAIVIAAAAVVALSVFFATRIKMQHRLLSEIGEDNPVSKANQVFEDSLFGVLSYGIEFEGPPDSMIEPDVLKKIDAVVGMIEKSRDIRKVLSLPQTLKEFNMKWMGEGEKYYRLPESRKLAAQYMEFFDPKMKREVVTEDYSKTRIKIMARNLPSSWWFGMMEGLRPALERSFPPGGKIAWRFNGSSHLAAVTLHHLMRDMFATVLTSLLAITIIMTLLFRSVRIGLISMIPNVIPLVTTAGFMGAAGIELRPATSIIFAISLGIAVNDTIHLMARYREEMLVHPDSREAVVRTILTAGKPVLYTSILLTLGYLVLLKSEFIAVRDFSLLLSVTLVSALACDLFLTSVLLVHTGRKLIKSRPVSSR